MSFCTPPRALLGALGLLLVVAAPAAAQYPRARPWEFEVRGLDFRPSGAWRKQAGSIRAARRPLIGAGNLARLNSPLSGGSALVVTGSFNIPVVPIRFSNTDTTALFSPSAYQDLFFSPAPVGRPYSVKTYYEQLSNGYISISGRVFPWTRADSTAAYYENNCNGIGVSTPCADGGARFGTLLLGALARVSAGADSATVWSDYDNDGPDGVPNSGDDDGYVDFVTFLQPEIDGACGTVHIWAHRYVIDAWNGGSPFVTKTPSARGGFIKISDYTIQSGQGGNLSCTAGQIMPIGTVAHETGHAFGLPDLYDTGNDAATRTQGIGEYGLMGSGNYSRPYSPSRMSGWSMLELGWVRADTLRTTGTVVVNPVATSDTVWVLPTQTAGEYFLLENRAAVESDSAQMNPAYGHAKSPGLYVWHIDQTRIQQGTWSNTINTGPTHGVALVQADGLRQLDTPGGGNRGDIGDAFPGSTGVTALDGCTTPGLRTNLGKLVSGRIDSIRIGAGAEVRLRFRREHLLQVAMSGTGTIESSVPDDLQGCLGVAEGTSVTLTAVPQAGHRFLGWSGDTTTINPGLTFTMNRSWSLTAQFLAPFTAAAAADDLLGVPALSAAQRTLLDQDGNKNGVYDLGDFLHLVSTSGEGIPPALMARVLAAAGPTPARTPTGGTR